MATLTPAYGRDYKNAEDARQAFLSGKDFIFHEVGSRWDRKPCSIRDFKAGETPSVTIRYNRLRSSIVVDL